jgi:hypothetical protein
VASRPAEAPSSSSRRRRACVPRPELAAGRGTWTRGAKDRRERERTPSSPGPCNANRSVSSVDYEPPTGIPGSARGSR